MVVIFFNLLGVAMVGLSWGIAVGLASLLGPWGYGAENAVAGSIAILCDGTCRWKTPTGHWFHPARGGNLLFLPIWFYGMGWLLLGMTHLVFFRDRDKVPEAVAATVVIAMSLTVISVAIIRFVRAMPAESSAAEPSWECSRCGHANAGHRRVCKQCRLEI
jgi:hypothetical protein